MGSPLQVLLPLRAVLHQLLRHLLLLRAVRLLGLWWFLRLPVGLRRRCPSDTGSDSGYGTTTGGTGSASCEVLRWCFEE